LPPGHATASRNCNDHTKNFAFLMDKVTDATALAYTALPGGGKVT
jgi:serine/threonine protein kinase HipA of HipAB toxin-antitoxin module